MSTGDQKSLLTSFVTLCYGAQLVTKLNNTDGPLELIHSIREVPFHYKQLKKQDLHHT